MSNFSSSSLRNILTAYFWPVALEIHDFTIAEQPYIIWLEHHFQIINLRSLPLQWSLPLRKVGEKVKSINFLLLFYSHHLLFQSWLSLKLSLQVMYVNLN
jgi:hypothetical protein